MANRCKEKVRKMFIVKGYLSEKRSIKIEVYSPDYKTFFFSVFFPFYADRARFFFFSYIELIFTIREKQRMEILRIFDLNSSLKGQEKTTY